MATRRAVAASIVSAALFSSLLVSNFIVFSGATQDFHFSSLASEEKDYSNEALLLRSTVVLDLLDGAQELLSGQTFSCSNSSQYVAGLLTSEKVFLNQSTLEAQSHLSMATDASLEDNLTALHPFEGSMRGLTNMAASTLVQGRSDDKSVVYHKAESHLLHLPLRLGRLNSDCLFAYYALTSALSGLGDQLCNSTLLSYAVSTADVLTSVQALSDGFSISIIYAIVSSQTCGVGFVVSAQQLGIPGPEGTFKFSERVSGYVWA